MYDVAPPWKQIYARMRAAGHITDNDALAGWREYKYFTGFQIGTGDRGVLTEDMGGWRGPSGSLLHLSEMSKWATKTQVSPTLPVSMKPVGNSAYLR